jgi:hypothetical protein
MMRNRLKKAFASAVQSKIFQLLRKEWNSNKEWLDELKKLYNKAPWQTKYVVRGGIPIAGYFWHDHSLDDGAESMRNLCTRPPLTDPFGCFHYYVSHFFRFFSFQTVLVLPWDKETADIVTKVVQNRKQEREDNKIGLIDVNDTSDWRTSWIEAFNFLTTEKFSNKDIWDQETVQIVARVVRNRRNALSVSSQRQPLHINDSKGKEDEYDWRQDWRTAFDVLTGPLLAGNKIPLEQFTKGQLLLNLWGNSWKALDISVSASFTRDSPYPSNKSFEHLFKRTALLANKRFKNIATLDVFSFGETDYLSVAALGKVSKLVGSIFKMPANALHMWPRNYGLSVGKSDFGVCLPRNFRDMREVLFEPESSKSSFLSWFQAEPVPVNSFLSNLLMVLDRDVVPVELSTRGKFTAAWENLPKRLLLFVPEDELLKLKPGAPLIDCATELKAIVLHQHKLLNKKGWEIGVFPFRSYGTRFFISINCLIKRVGKLEYFLLGAMARCGSLKIAFPIASSTTASLFRDRGIAKE